MSSEPTWQATDRLTLRPWRADEAERLFDIRRRDEVVKWLGDPTPWTSLETAHQKIASWQELTDSAGPDGVWAITATDQNETYRGPLGTVRIGRLPGSDEIDIGWDLHPDSAGHGFATEAASALLTRSLQLAEVERVWAVMWPHNEPSARVAASIGMIDLGVINDPWYGTEADSKSRIFRAELARL